MPTSPPARILLATLLLLAVGAHPARAQEGTWLGVIIGGTPSFGSLATSDATVYPGTPDCGSFTAGTTASWWVGGVFERPRLFSATLGLRARLGWGGATTSFETPAVDPIVLPGENNTIIQAEHAYSLETSEKRARLELALIVPLGGALTFGGGLSVDGLSSSFTAAQTDRLTSGDVLFDSGRTSRPMALAEAYSGASLTLGGVVGVSGRIPLGKAAAIVPSLDLTLGAASPLAGHSGLMLGARVGVALMFNAGNNSNPPDTAPPPLLAVDSAQRSDTSRRDSTPLVDRSMNVAIDMHGEDAAGAPSSEAIVLLNETVERVIDKKGDTSEHNSRTVTPPKLRLQPAMHVGAGVRRWRIDLLYEGRVVARYDDTGAVANDEVKWRITESEAARSASTLTALLAVEDSLGTTATAQATLPIRFVRHGRIVLRDSSRSLLLTTLYPQESPGAEELSERDLDALDEFSLQLPGGARVEVLLNSEENRAEGMRRARLVAEELRHLLRLRRAPTILVTSLDDRALGGKPPEGVLLSRSIAVRATLPDRGER